MSDHILTKGYVATGSTAYAFGELVVQGSSNTTMARATVAAAQVLGVMNENLDAAKVTTGKAAGGVNILGIARVLAGGAIARGAKVTNNTAARAVTAGAAGTNAFGIALTPAAADGDVIEVLLTPGNTV